MKRIKHVLQIAIGVLSLSSCAAAYADTFTSYQINSTLADGGTFNAVLNFDSTYVFGTTLVGSYTTARLSGLVNEKISVLEYDCIGVGCGQTTGLIFGVPQGQINLVYPGLTTDPNVVIPFNGVLCVQGSSVCDGSSIYFGNNSIVQSIDDFGNTTVIPLASTPEPSGLALLGTGVLGLVGAMRRRRV